MRPSSMVLGRQLPGGGTPGKTLPTIGFASPLNADDSSYCATTTLSITADQQVFRDSPTAMNSTPTDFVSMDTLSITLIWTFFYNTGNDDDITVGWIIQTATDSTLLAAFNSGGDLEPDGAMTSGGPNGVQMPTGGVNPVGDTTITDDSFGYVNTSATKAQWDDAEIVFYSSLAKVMGPDSSQARIDYAEVNGTYTWS